MNDKERGLNALTQYHSAMRMQYPTSFRLSLSQFLEALKKIKGGKALQEGLGLGIREAGLSDSKVKTSMFNLARAGQGKVPASYMDYFNFLIMESSKISYIDMAGFVLIESAKTVAGGAQDLGDSLITSLKALNALLPIFLIGGTALVALSWLNKTTGGDLIKVIKSVKK